MPFLGGMALTPPGQTPSPVCQVLEVPDQGVAFVQVTPYGQERVDSDIGAMGAAAAAAAAITMAEGNAGLWQCIGIIQDVLGGAVWVRKGEDVDEVPAKRGSDEEREGEEIVSIGSRESEGVGQGDMKESIRSMRPLLGGGGARGGGQEDRKGELEWRRGIYGTTPRTHTLVTLSPSAHLERSRL